ncbi:TauD/TfdA family dioxygenase [Nostoc sp. FACHB-152]|uniref:TauD/TfdA family dioxygenase n=1 Tax=unclassified Nostoc TaxID=2593658 RepID=UPI00168A2E93|nr:MULTISPECIES: TauD/TfdA family dioxygenase [unclassified Nostoc]MBD2451078.1 TauD/TfdA family dioxygenase [Nostoc sp. FACHB-152]MBD2472582.1 TauD/TfdA family dioxygenase [Nostoc sp. FACHB-145]
MEFYKKIEFTSPEQTKKDIQEAIEKYKIVHFVGFDFQIDIHDYFTEISDCLGLVIDMDEDKDTGKRTGQRWIDISYDPARPNKYRSSKTRQPLHTDNSYLNHHDAVNYFYCLSQAQVGGATFFLDSDLLIKVLELDNEYQLLEDLKTIPVCFSKQGVSKTTPIITEDELGLRLNYNYYPIDPDNTPEAKDLVERFQLFLENRVHNSGIYTDIILKKGDAVFFHDERLLHGRNAFFTSNKGDRVLLKGSVILHSRKHKNLELFGTV